jgi:enoyl-CoA hydratase/carnithine racemase
MLEQTDRALWWHLPTPGITHAVLDELEIALDQVAADLHLRALVITGGAEKYDQFFAVGMDITFLGKCFADPVGTFIPFVARYHELLHRIEESEVPVIAAVNGLARAGGFELLLACDVVLVANEAKIGDGHSASGVTPGAGAGVRAQRVLGPQRARHLLLGGGWYTAQEAVAFGMAAQAVDRSQLKDEARQLAAKFNDMSRSALAATKRCLLEASPTREACQKELAIFADFITNDPLAAEGYRAWVEKRKANWP